MKYPGAEGDTMHSVTHGPLISAADCRSAAMGILVIVFFLSTACGLRIPSNGVADRGQEGASMPVYYVLEPYPQPKAVANLQPGLDVVYFFDYSARNLDVMPEYNPAKPRGTKGAPISNLNHHFGYGQVFNSGVSQEVGMRFTGWIHLAQSGEYAFQALSNDGIRVFIGGQKILDDPTQHSDRLTGPVVSRIQNPGWHPIRVDYFQRKGTAAIVLSWQPPGSDGFVPIPPEMLAHEPINP